MAKSKAASSGHQHRRSAAEDFGVGLTLVVTPSGPVVMTLEGETVGSIVGKTVVGSSSGVVVIVVGFPDHCQTLKPLGWQ